MSNIISATFSCGSTTASASGLWQYDYGQKLIFAGLDLPPVYEVHFAGEGETETITVLGNETGVDIPDQFLLSGNAVKAWVFLHTGTEDGETMYAVRMPVNKRPEPSDTEPTPVQQDIITQAIAALDAAVEQTGQDVETTAGYMDRAEQAADRAEQAAQGVEEYAERAETAAEGAEASATNAGQSEQTATQAASAAVTAATQAGTSASQAQQAASDAGQAANSAADAASAAGMFATTAETRAEEATASASAAAESAASAAGSETVASQAAQTATQKVSEASQSATSAAQSAQSAEQSATSAEQSAQSAEQSAESILDVLPEIQQDITDLQDTKADKDGSYDYLTAGLANQLATDKGITDSVPYLLRPSGGGVAVGSYEQDKIVGGSIVWNQLNVNRAITSSGGGVTFTKNDNGSWTLTGAGTGIYRKQFANNNETMLLKDHVYFLSFGEDFSGSASTIQIFISASGGSIYGFDRDSIAKMAVDRNQFSVRTYAGFVAPEGGLTIVPQVFDLTAMFDSAIADYIHSLETATSGAGVAWLKQHFPKQFDAGYQEYNAGEIKSVGGLVSHEMRDANDNIIAAYALDTDLVLRGIPKITDGKLSYDGDIYSPEGTVERRFAERAYQSGDESLTDALTDGTVTVYKLTTPTTETAAPYQTPQLVDPDGTEEYVLADGAFPMPVGHETFYPADLKKKIEDLPDNPVEDVQVDGVSVVQGGVANVPIANANNFGVVMVSGYGLQMQSNGCISTKPSTFAEVKAGVRQWEHISPTVQHASAFYGLAKAAGDTTQSASSNAVGAYTDEAKIAIQKMLGIYEPPYELLNTITFSEEGRIDLTTDDIGLPYNLRNVFISILYPANATAVASGYSRFRFYDANNNFVNAETGRYQTATSQKYKLIHVERKANLTIVSYIPQTLAGGHGSWVTKNINVSGLSSAGSGASIIIGNITRIFEPTEDAEPAGTVIRIYGQRAY